MIGCVKKKMETSRTIQKRLLRLAFQAVSIYDGLMGRVGGQVDCSDDSDKKGRGFDSSLHFFQRTCQSEFCLVATHLEKGLKLKLNAH